MSFVTSLFKTPKIDRPPLDTGLTANPPRKLIIGKTANGGDFVFKGLSDFESGDNRDFSTVMVLAGHECNRLTRVWVNGELVHGELFNGQRVAIDDYFDEGKSSRPRLWLTYHNGSPNQTADSFLAGTNISPVNINSSARLRGCAYVVATMRHDNDILTSELTFRFEYEGANLYDRRKDTTAGGSGSHRLNDPSTWEYTDNPQVGLDHYRLGLLGGQNNDQIIFGMGEPVWKNPYDIFEADADLCDEQVFGQSRYAFNGRISSADDHSEVIQRFAKQMAAEPYYSGGRLFVRPKQARPIKITLYDSDLVDDAPYELSVSPGGDDLTNTIKGSFSDPDSMYDSVDYPDIADSDLISKDGRIFEDTLDLPDEINEARAQRIAAIDLEVQKRRDQISETFMPIANVLEVGDWYERVSELRGAVTKIYEVVDLEKGRGNGHRVKVVGQETDSSVTAFGENQAVPIVRPSPLPALEISRLPPPEITANPITITSGGAALPSVEIIVTPPAGEALEGVAYFEVQYGISNGLTDTDLGIVDGGATLQQFDNLGQLTLPINATLPSAVYAYRIRTITNRNPGEWGPFKTVTTQTDLISTNSVAVGGATLSDLSSDIAQAEADAAIEAQARVDAARSQIEGAAQTARNLLSDDIDANGQSITQLDTSVNGINTRLNAVSVTDADGNAITLDYETMSAQAYTRLRQTEIANTTNGTSISNLQTLTADTAQTVSVLSADINDPQTGLNARASLLEARATSVEGDIVEVSADLQLQASLAPNALNLNAEFGDYKTGDAAPANWTPTGNITGQSVTYRTGRSGGNAVELRGDAGETVGLSQFFPASSGIFSPGYYILETDAYREFGTFESAGVQISLYSGSNQYEGLQSIRFQVDVAENTDAFQPGSGKATKLYRWSKLLDLTSATLGYDLTAVQLRASAHNPNLGSTASLNKVIFESCVIRRATAAEIELQQAFDDTGSTLTERANTLADIEGFTEANYGVTLTSIAGGLSALAGFAIRTAVGATTAVSNFVIFADKITLASGTALFQLLTNRARLNVPLEVDNVGANTTVIAPTADIALWFGADADVGSETVANAVFALDASTGLVNYQGQPLVNGGGGVYYATPQTSTGTTTLTATVASFQTRGGSMLSSGSFTAKSLYGYTQTAPITNGNFASGSARLRILRSVNSGAFTQVGTTVTVDGTLQRVVDYDAEGDIYIVEEVFTMSENIDEDATNTAGDNVQWRIIADQITGLPSGHTVKTRLEHFVADP